MEKVCELTQDMLAMVAYHEENIGDIIPDVQSVKASAFCEVLQDAEKIGSADDLLDATASKDSMMEDTSYEDVLHTLGLFEDDDDAENVKVFYYLIATYALTDNVLLDSIKEEIGYCKNSDPELWDESMEQSVLTDEEIAVLADWASDEF